jgi:hypothetical protein
MKNFTGGNGGNGGASRCIIHGSSEILLGPANERLGDPSNWLPPFAIDSKPPHGFSPFGHVAFAIDSVPPQRHLTLRARRVRSCPNDLQAFGRFVQTTYKPSVVLFKNLKERKKEVGGRGELMANESKAFEKIPNRDDQRWVMDVRSIPDYRILGSKIAVGKDITKSGDGAPRNLCNGISELGGQIFYRLTDDFKVPSDRIDSTAVGHKGIVVKAANVALDSRSRLEDIFQTKGWVTRHAGGQVGCVGGSGPGKIPCYGDRLAFRADLRGKI